jgi:[acyl-carrier-protein] S-malonyltransferase
MAAIIGMEDEVVERICREINSEVVVPANYNTPGQLVISGSVEGVNLAVENLKAAGAKLTVLLNVGGAFHSPLMEPARQELEAAIQNTEFHPPICPIYQNVNARPETDPAIIQQNLVAQLTAPVRWTQTIQQMVADGAKTFVETGPGTVLQKMVKKIERSAEALSAEASLEQ